MNLGKYNLILSAVTFLAVSFVIYRSYYPFSFAGDYNPSGDQVTTDLLGKSVTLPQGQIWGFNPDQTLTTKIVGKRQIDVDTVLLTVDISAAVHFPPPKEVKKDDPPSPKKASLTGLAKVFYEKHGNSWYLTNIEGVNLKVDAE